MPIYRLHACIRFQNFKMEIKFNTISQGIFIDNKLRRKGYWELERKLHIQFARKIHFQSDAN